MTVCEPLFVCSLFLGFLLLVSFIRKARKFEDYERIRDYHVIGFAIWLVGICTSDQSLVKVGMCIYCYGLILLLYNYYKKGYEESLGGK